MWCVSAHAIFTIQLESKINNNLQLINSNIQLKKIITVKDIIIYNY